ncbi:hypothetical protein KABACHOK_05390 [Brevundimonas phage vB_BpoS-Kabachok]|uniref:Uncharacterized protein n=1 Tax=Brevundimonas phage vB_BpoS-Kabachok TaxID=2948600 RepID=A0A9E7SM12_9CAUD|nr:hypothetical protein KABACHOK_05390 [Brevundimonas phage vB_BpoS-Kabachok]
MGLPVTERALMAQYHGGVIDAESGLEYGRRDNRMSWAAGVDRRQIGDAYRRGWAAGRERRLAQKTQGAGRR